MSRSGFELVRGVSGLCLHTECYFVVSGLCLRAGVKVFLLLRCSLVSTRCYSATVHVHSFQHIMFKFSVMVQVKGHSKYKKSVETLYIYLQTSQQYTRALSNASLAKHLTLTFKVKVDLVKCVNKPY